MIDEPTVGAELVNSVVSGWSVSRSLGDSVMPFDDGANVVGLSV